MLGKRLSNYKYLKTNYFYFLIKRLLLKCFKKVCKICVNPIHFKKVLYLKACILSYFNYYEFYLVK